MLTVIVKTGTGLHKQTGVVRVNGVDKLSPQVAKAALRVAGYTTGAVWTDALWDDETGEFDYDAVYGYRVYPKSVRKLHIFN